MRLWTEVQSDNRCAMTRVQAINQTEVKRCLFPVLTEEVRVRDLEAL